MSIHTAPVTYTNAQKVEWFDKLLAEGAIDPTLFLADFSSTLASEVQALTQFTEPSWTNPT